MRRAGWVFATLVLLAPTAASAQSAPPSGPGAPGSTVAGPVLDITADVLDLTLTVSALDGSTSDIDRGREVDLQLAADVFFAFGQADLTPDASTVLAGVAERLRTQAVGTVSVVGHTDAVGDDASNLTLSQRRAGTVVTDLNARLTGTGLTLAASGKGEAEPVAPNALPDGKDNPDGRQQNRRVTITFVKK